ncbi:21 kDa protein-like [Punica granatum]|uniref:Pectinesterase inhibitor domain-containing protein n=2 Tax=Punica granatum TaxID=22663 RepID=A0A218XUX1_PUNGR|nr:21 kDa protein-like [Punica granatum]OWM88399.1 hypothetical protein CDL15_Pgr003811 [Punica granatum]PKI49480.1 hypothetical protein CRG98_030097 [Punica granatum]
MARVALPHLVLIILLSMEAPLAQPTASTKPLAAASDSTDFIEVSCRSTRYPPLCVQCLSSYARVIRQNEQALARVALSVTLSRARQAMAFVARMRDTRGIRPRENGAVRDCVANLGSSVDRLVQSIIEMDQMNKAAPGDDFEWHVSNLETWVSGALTNANTCLDGFAGRAMDGNIKTTVRSKVLDLAQVMSNTLALMDRFAARHRRSSHGRHP